jgi:DNA-binding response OmpR family regulator
MKKVLIVEDEKNIVLSLKMFLTKAGFETESVANGIDAIRIAQDLVPDLILLDLILPGMNGYLVCEAIKQNQITKNIPVVIMSVKNQEEDISKAYFLGADDYIIKPFTIDQIKPIIEKFLEEDYL